MTSRGKVILAYVIQYIFYWWICVGFYALLGGRVNVPVIIFMTVWLLIWTGIALIKDLIQWKQCVGVIYPIYQKEGYSSHFFEVAEEYGTTLENVDVRSRYYLSLVAYYLDMNQYDKALIAFTKVDAGYIHRIEKKSGQRKRQLVRGFYNNGLYVCLKTGHMEDAKRIYQDGYPYLKKYENRYYIVDTLAEYHYHMKEYEKEVYYDEKLMKMGNLSTDVKQYATKRLEEGRKHLTGVHDDERRN